MHSAETGAGMTDFAVVTLSKGQQAVVDAADLVFLNGHSWYAIKRAAGGGFYAATTPFFIDGIRYSLMHRALLLAPPGIHIDHINRDPLDNRRRNLRFCTISENAANRVGHRLNRNGFRGVTKQGHRFSSKIKVRGKEKFLGTFPTAEEAGRAWDMAAREHFGEFARLNFPIDQPVP
jgi:hypothetical protein